MAWLSHRHLVVTSETVAVLGPMLQLWHIQHMHVRCPCILVSIFVKCYIMIPIDIQHSIPLILMFKTTIHWSSTQVVWMINQGLDMALGSQQRPTFHELETGLQLSPWVSRTLMGLTFLWFLAYPLADSQFYGWKHPLSLVNISSKANKCCFFLPIFPSESWWPSVIPPSNTPRHLDQAAA